LIVVIHPVSYIFDSDTRLPLPASPPRERKKKKSMGAKEGMSVALLGGCTEGTRLLPTDLSEVDTYAFGVERQDVR
jgi:hypothetical protein